MLCKLKHTIIFTPARFGIQWCRLHGDQSLLLFLLNKFIWSFRIRDFAMAEITVTWSQFIDHRCTFLNHCEVLQLYVYVFGRVIVKLEHIKSLDNTDAVIMIRRTWSSCAKAPVSPLSCIHLLLRLYTILRRVNSAICIVLVGEIFRGINRPFHYQ
jgi:hypothetical protein